MSDYDKAMGGVCDLLAALSITLHVRGTDDRPVIEVLDRRWRTVVGGIELKHRMARARLTNEQLEDIRHALHSSLHE